jgi:hypothetical protein
MTTKGPRRRGLNKLADRPELLAQAHPTRNGDLDVAALPTGSKTKVWWACQNGPDHEWEAAVYSRTAGRGCPFCAGQRVSVTNSLATLHPDVAAQFDRDAEVNAGLAPERLIAGSKTKVAWACPIGPDHRWVAVVQSRTLNGAGCPFCDGKKASANHTLATVLPELAVTWDADANVGLSPADFTPGSKKQVAWACPAAPDHRWVGPVYRYAGKNRERCPFCAGRRASQSNSLASLYPAVAAEYAADLNDGVTADQVVATSETKVGWRCQAGHEWRAQPRSRTKGGNGCPWCSGYYATEARTLAVTHPDVFAQFDRALNPGVDPLTLASTARRKYWWRCPVAADHVWEASPGQRTSQGGRGCRACAGKQVSTSNNLAAVAPVLAVEFMEERNGIAASEVVAGSNSKFWWRCATCQHEWLAACYSRTVHMTGCPNCVLTGRSVIELEVAAELAAFLPVDLDRHVVRGASRAWNVDIVVPDERLLVEYDGEYWHRDKESFDRLKTADLRSAGWSVIRIRAGLDPISAEDVAVASLDPAPRVAAVVLARVAEVRPGLVDESAAARYAASGTAVSADLAKRLVQEARERQAEKRSAQVSGLVAHD